VGMLGIMLLNSEWVSPPHYMNSVRAPNVAPFDSVFGSTGTTPPLGAYLRWEYSKQSSTVGLGIYVIY